MINKIIKNKVFNLSFVKNELQSKNDEIKKLMTEVDGLRYYNKIANQEKAEFKKIIFDLHQYRYQVILQKLKKKVKAGKKIRVCFFAMIDAAFAYEPLYEAMLKDKMFVPFIVVIPDTSRGKKHRNLIFSQTFSYFSKKYKNVFKGYDTQTNQYHDFSNNSDIVCFANPYEGMTSNIFEINYYLDKDILPVYIHYSFSVTKFSRETINNHGYDYFWKVFVPTKLHFDEFQKYQDLKGKNVVVSGYCKMDNLAKEKKVKRSRKLIILAPHHTVINWKSLQISNFIQYSDFYLQLPKIFPEIDFVFRPHPLLITQLKRTEIWGEVKTEQYFKTMQSYANVIYSKEAEYFNYFVNSDAIIHDCGSFIAEYLFTGKPACYVLKNKEAIRKWFLPIGQKCLDYHYEAYSEDDMKHFIDQIVINNKDVMKGKRIKFVNSELKINYPMVAEQIIDHIKQEILK